MRINFIILFFIIAFSFFIRFWQLSGVPLSLSHDEVAIGYNAWSILHTSKDEYGVKFPLLFRSFDDYKLPGMVYSTAISEKIFGLNEFGVRFPSAFFGFLSVLVFYFIAKAFFGKSITLSIGKLSVSSSTIATFFFATSLWHINFSRQAFESNGALFFLMLGVVFLLRFLKSPIMIVFALLFFAVSFYFYYSVRIAVPLIFVTFIIIYRKEILKNILIVTFALVVGFLTLLPLLPYMFSVGGFARISIVSVVNDPSYVDRQEDYAKLIERSNNNPAFRVLFNRRVALIQTIIDNYLKNISLNHIFFSGTGSLGLTYAIEAPIFFLGLYALFKKKEKMKWIFIAWFFVYPLTGAFTVNQPNALRTLVGAPMLSFICAIGFLEALAFFKRNNLEKKFLVSFLSLFLISFSYFYMTYFFPKSDFNAISFADGHKQMVEYLKQNEHEYKEIYITGAYWRPYIFTLFWKKYDPNLYQKFGTINGFDKYVFGAADWDNEGINFNDRNVNLIKLTNKSKDVLFILSPSEYKKYKYALKKLKSIDGKFAKEVFTAAVIK